MRIGFPVGDLMYIGTGAGWREAWPPSYSRAPLAPYIRTPQTSFHLHILSNPLDFVSLSLLPAQVPGSYMILLK